jgi:ribonucleotide monophosphatase NagD (HAD superfamily)
VSPLVVGKPEPLLAQMALAKLGLEPSQVAVIGDRLYTDMEMGHRAGTMTILVLSGETTTAMVEEARRAPDIVVPDLLALVSAIEPRMPRELTA